MKPDCRMMSEEVAAYIVGCPAEAQSKLLALRELIIARAAADTRVGMLQEALRWGEPAYLTTQSKSGTTIRLGYKAATPEVCYVFVNCKTNLLERYRGKHSRVLAFEGNRAVVIPLASELSQESLADFIDMALTYKL